MGVIVGKNSIYPIKGKEVSAKIPKKFGGYVIKGIVEEVHRDVIQKKIQLSVDKWDYIFKEPVEISEEEGCLKFYYDCLGSDNDQIEIVFEVKDGHDGKTIKRRKKRRVGFTKPTIVKCEKTSSMQTVIRIERTVKKRK
jgi:hypothetical protein